MANQTINGKAFEYALLFEFYERLKAITSVLITENAPFINAKGCFNSFVEQEQDTFRITASTAVNFLIDIEPRLSNGINEEDILVLEIVSDQAGIAGDVRDVLIIRSLQKWEIGISAKNNHRAVKHSRLSLNIDFGEKWLGVPCSQNYFDEIKPIFDILAELKSKNKSTKWTSIENMHQVVYKDNSTTTLLVSLNEGWQISFRIHNASSRVEPSLKFDINLVSAPHTLFTNHIFIP
jgi:hypothetical protein